MGPLLRSCVEVCELIKLSFGMESGVVRGIDVLDGIHVPQDEGAVSGIFRHLRPPLHLDGQNDVLFVEKCI